MTSIADYLPDGDEPSVEGAGVLVETGPGKLLFIPEEFIQDVWQTDSTWWILTESGVYQWEPLRYLVEKYGI